MFKLLAIRPLEGCADYIQKCLKTGMIYYFCNDYIIEPGSHIRRRSKNIEPLEDDFFSVPNMDDYYNNEDGDETISPTVSVSAIVGKNGDGKSTLVELMMRLINNCAISYQLCVSSDNPDKEKNDKTEAHYNLRRVTGVKAELYYMVDKVVYRMAEEKDDEGTRIWKIADLDTINEKGEESMRWNVVPMEIKSFDEDLNCFFFTIVSNYSHYAYNVDDYEKEWEVLGGEKDDNEKCWLHYVFHKYDGYLAPITLLPSRDRGNININIEKNLSKQRLLSLFINADNPSDNPLSFRRVNGKDANILKLKEVTESKLQQKAIIEYFKTTTNQENRYKDLVNEINRVDEEVDRDDTFYDPDFEEKYGSFDFNLGWLEGRIQSSFVNPINQIIGQDTNFSVFASKIVAWIENLNNILPNTGELGSVIDRIIMLNNKTIHYKKAIAFNNNADQYYSEGHYDKALEYYDEALKISEPKIGRVHPLTARIYLNIASVFRVKHDYDKAIDYYKKVKFIYYKLASKYKDNGISSKYLNMAEKLERDPFSIAKPLIVPRRLVDANEVENETMNKWESITKQRFLYKINALQLGRLDTLYRIINAYNKTSKGKNIDINIVTKDYFKLSLEEKCQHYIVYKVWSILSKYTNYRDAFEKDNIESLREFGEKMEGYIEQIKKDHSHITLKLRQVENFMKEGFADKRGLYQRLVPPKERKSEPLLVKIDELKKHYHGKPIPLDNLPPPIYNWDILFQKKEDPNCVIEFDSFSSGEKQLLYSIGAIIYHLQNLANSSSEIKYNNVNLIMEEIELYYHPEYQRLYFYRLLNLIKRANLGNIQNINFVFVTHSPFILSDIPKCNVLFLKEGVPDDEMQENTFGANIHSLLKHGFFMPNLPIGEFAYRKINELFKQLNTGDFNTKNEEERKKDLDAIYQQILLVGEPFLRNQLLLLYNAFKGSK